MNYYERKVIMAQMIEYFRIREEIYRELEYGTKYYDRCPVYPIYHYTSVSSFLSIMGHQDDKKQPKPILWFSRYDCMNDMSEGERLYTVLNEILEQEKNNTVKKYETDFLQTISDYKENYKRVDTFSYGNNLHDLFVTMSSMEYYICCFSKNRDLLPLWNYYVKDGSYAGYNIGMLLNDKYHGIRQDGMCKGFIYEIRPVIYAEEKIKDIIYKCFDELYKTYKTEKYKECLEAIFRIFEELRIFIKDRHFAYEEEVRIVIKVPKELPADPPEKFAENCTLPSPIKYRNKDGLIIPYFEFPLDGTCVKEITVGPLNKGDIAKATLTSFLQDNGYIIADEEHPDGVKICKSEVPIRY